MKKVLLLSLLVAFTMSVNAQTSEKKWGVGVGIGAYGSINNGGSGFMPEIYLSRYLDSKFDIMVKFQDGFNTVPEFKNNVPTGNRIIGNDNANILLNLRYKLTDESKKFRPYLFAGPGYLSDNKASGINFDLGIGSKHYFAPSAALYFEAAYMHGIEGERTVGNVAKTVRDNLWKATVGFEYDFIKAKDTDMDGVPDVKDKCPDTPAGVNVDDKGCPVDTDGDGVADYLDDCPTVAGLTSLKGCPDKDKDGIADKNDACPDVAGIASLKGCPDTDGDGIADNDDKCPNTKKGSKVDSNGCPLDTDKDGVIDSEDNCPGTAQGVKVDEKGCPIKEVIKEIDKTKEVTADEVEIQDIKIEAVHFVSNKYYLTDFSKGRLDKLIQILKSNPAYNVNAHGYTDSQGSDQLNLKLSQNRVASVVEYLTANGISEKRIIQQKALGKADPVATNDTPEGRLLNRRVEFEIFKLK